MSAHEIIDAFVLEMLPGAPLRRQIEVALAMAERAATPAERKQWRAIAVSLVERERDVRQLYLGFAPSPMP